MSGRKGIAGAAALGALLAMFVAASSAHGFIYWVDDSGDEAAIGRASNDGTGVDRDFIVGLPGACGLAVDDQHIYWGNQVDNGIGRANLDGTGVEPTFIANEPGFGFPCDPEVRGQKIWWTNQFSTAQKGSIARANLDGTGVESGRITGTAFASTPFGLATDDEFVYWSNVDIDNPPPEPSIGRSGLEGVPAPVGNFVPNTFPLFTLWLAATDAHVYGALTFQLASGVGILRWDDGANLSEVGRGSATGGLAIHGGTLYWANSVEGTISRSNLDGRAQEFAFVRGAGEPRGLVVDGGAPPPNDFAFGKLKRNKRKGTAKLSVDVPGPGSLSLAGKGLKPSAAEAGQGGTVKLAVAPAGKQKRKLKRRGKLSFEAEVTFAPSGTGGVANTESTPLKLIRR